MPENDQRHDGDRALTSREREVLELVGAGLVEQQIAERLQIAGSTVALLLRSSMAKLGVRTRVEAARSAAANRPATTQTPSSGGNQ